MKNAKHFICLAFIGFVCTGIASAQFGWGRQAPLAVYSPYGLSYDSAKEAWTYQNKIVGLFIDEQGWGRSFLSLAGEIHVKVNRDTYGKISSITELTQPEYATVLEEMDAQQVAMRKQMKEQQDTTRGNTAPQPPATNQRQRPSPSR